MNDKTKKRGLFITLEGIEGVGKSTHLEFIKNYLATHDVATLTTREPGGTEIAENIRQILLKTPTEKVSDITELLLLFAGRAQHIINCIEPALASGQWVICDRFTDATYAYQGAGRGLPLDWISSLEHWVQGTLQPDYVILLDAPVEITVERTAKRTLDRIESETTVFFQRVRQSYLERSKQYPDRYRVVDANFPIEEVQNNLKILLDKIINHYDCRI